MDSKYFNNSKNSKHQKDTNYEPTDSANSKGSKNYKNTCTERKRISIMQCATNEF